MSARSRRNNRHNDPFCLGTDKDKGKGKDKGIVNGKDTSTNRGRCRATDNGKASSGGNGGNGSWTGEKEDPWTDGNDLWIDPWTGPWNDSWAKGKLPQLQQPIKESTSSSSAETDGQVKTSTRLPKKQSSNKQAINMAEEITQGRQKNHFQSWAKQHCTETEWRLGHWKSWRGAWLHRGPHGDCIWKCCACNRYMWVCWAHAEQVDVDKCPWCKEEYQMDIDDDFNPKKMDQCVICELLRGYSLLS